MDEECAFTFLGDQGRNSSPPTQIEVKLDAKYRNFSTRNFPSYKKIPNIGDILDEKKIANPNHYV